MLKQYQELLETLETASQKARAICESRKSAGAAERTFITLQRPLAELRQHVKATEDFMKRQSEIASANKKAPQLPEEPCPVPTPEQLENANAVSTGPAAAAEKSK